MAEFWDKLKTEFNRAGKAAQEALDETKLRYDLFKVRQSADKAAQALGYAVYRARKDATELSEESYSRLSRTLAEYEAEAARIEEQMRAIDADPDAPGPTAEAKADAAPETPDGNSTTSGA